MENFTNILNNYLSPIQIIRSTAETQLNEFITREDPNDLDFLFQALHSNYNNSVKLFIAILIKKVFDTSINDSNRMRYKEYISSRKIEIINTVLNVNADLKTINFLVIILENCINLFESDLDKDSNGLNTLSPEEIFEYIFTSYNQNKSLGNIDMTFQQLYISFKILKFLKEWKHKSYSEFLKVLCNFYDKIFCDFEEILQNYIQEIEINEGENVKRNLESLNILTQYIKLYFKIAKHSVNFFIKEQRDKIMTLTFNFLYKTLFYLNHQNFLSYSNQTEGKNVNLNIFDCIFLANKILLKYTACFAKLDLLTVKNFAELFYIYVSENTVFTNLMNILRLNYGGLLDSCSNRLQNASNKEKKFMTDIIDFFKELLQLTSFDNWGDLILFKDCFSEENVEISDYLNNEFFVLERVQNLIVFSIKNCMTFGRDEIEMALNDVEEFYTYYDTMTPQFDLREKASLLCRIIYDKYKKFLKVFHQNLDEEIIRLTKRDFEGEPLTFEESNLKCGMLFYFESLAYIYSNKIRDWPMWIREVLLNPLDIDLVCKPGKETFSTFIILRILMKIIDFKELTELRKDIFYKVYGLFYNLGKITDVNSSKITIPDEKLQMIYLLKLGCIDFFYAFFDDLISRDFPNDFLKNSIYPICEMLKTLSSPDIHNKIIKTTIAILSKFPDEEIEENFPYIFSVLKYLWNNTNSRENEINNLGLATNFLNKTPLKRTNVNSISIVRQNMIKLIAIFIKKIGIFITFPHTEEVNTNIPVDTGYFEFVYDIIGYSISVKSQESNFLQQEALKLILLIQDEFYKINCVNKNLSVDILIKPPEFYQYFSFYYRIYDFLPIILHNISTSEDFYLAQFLILEQYLSLISVREVKEFLISIGIVEKLILIIKNSVDRNVMQFSGPIFNFIEFCLYILNSNNKLQQSISENNFYMQVNSFNNFVYQIVENIFTNFDANCENILRKIAEENDSENSNLNIPSVQELNLFTGAIQLSNRLIFVNYFYYNNSNIEFYFRMLNYLNLVTQNKIIGGKITVNDKKILSSLIRNLKKIFSLNKDFENVNKISELAKLFSAWNSSNFLDKNNHTLNHWLFFFNKINSDTYFYHLTAMEDLLRHYWTAKLEKMNYFDVDLTNLNFDLKYYSLLCDEMYKEENYLEEEI